MSKYDTTYLASSLWIYSHSQWLFYEFVSKITNKLVKQSLRVTVVAFAIRAMYGLPWCCWCQAIKQIYEWPHVPCMLLEASPNSWLLNLSCVKFYVDCIQFITIHKVRTLTSTSFLQEKAALSSNCDSIQSFTSWPNGHFGVDKYMRSNDVCMP